jgi:hypothetical protein
MTMEKFQYTLVTFNEVEQRMRVFENRRGISGPKRVR